MITILDQIMMSTYHTGPESLFDFTPCSVNDSYSANPSAFDRRHRMALGPVMPALTE